MGQALSNLTVGTVLNIPELENGVSTLTPYIIIKTGSDNPYGASNVTVLRKNVGGSSIKFDNDASNLEYEDSLLDTTMTSFYTNMFDEDTQALIATSNVICYSVADGAAYTLSRKVFSLSYKEVGGSLATDESTDLGFFTTAASRIAYYAGTETASWWWLRSPVSTTKIGAIYTSGGLNEGSPTSNFPYRPAMNLINSALVSDEANEDGSYNLLPSSEHPNLTMSFDCLLGTSTARPRQVLVNCDYVCSGTVTAQICNNYKDASPKWQNITIGNATSISNTSKTADTWALGLKITATAENTMRFSEPTAIVLLDQ